MKRVLLALLIGVAVIASLSAVSAGLFDILSQEGDNMTELDNIAFNTTVENFILYNNTTDEGVYWLWYIDENDTGYNVQIFNLSAATDSEHDEWMSEYLESFEGFPSQDIDGVTVYNVTATTGDNIGDARYVAYVKNKDLETVIDICAPDINETVKIASSLKFN